MTNEQDQIAAQVARQVAPRGNPRQAASGGVGNSTTTVSASRVVDGVVKRLWLTGDDFSARFYFGEYK